MSDRTPTPVAPCRDAPTGPCSGWGGRLGLTVFYRLKPWSTGIPIRRLHARSQQNLEQSELGYAHLVGWRKGGGQDACELVGLCVEAPNRGPRTPLITIGTFELLPVTQRIAGWALVLRRRFSPMGNHTGDRSHELRSLVWRHLRGADGQRWTPHVDVATMMGCESAGGWATRRGVAQCTNLGRIARKRYDGPTATIRPRGRW